MQEHGAAEDEVVAARGLEGEEVRVVEAHLLLEPLIAKALAGEENMVPSTSTPSTAAPNRRAIMKDALSEHAA
jgi:hypothetical protein